MAERAGRHGYRGSLAGLILLAIGFATPTDASAGLLDGKTAIRDIDVLKITDGRARGSLLVSVRVAHAPTTSRAAARESSGSTHLATTTVVVRGRTLESTQQLSVGDLPGSRRLPHVYSLRVRKPGAIGSGAIGVRATTTQRLDLDADGDTDASRSDSKVAKVRTTRVAEAINPPSGKYRARLRLNLFFADVSLTVQAGAVVGVLAVYGAGGRPELWCIGEGLDNVRAPIDPATGAFSYFSPKPGLPIKLSGTFTDDGASAGGSVTGMNALPENCPPFPVPSSTAFSPG